MNLGEAARDISRVEVGGIHIVGEESGRARKTCIDESIELDLEVVDKKAKVMEARSDTIRVHVAIDRRLVVVLHDELNHHLAEVAKRVRHVGLGCGAAVVEAVTSMMFGHEERARAERG